MTKLLMFREQLKKLYAKYGNYIKPLARFFTMIISMIVINANVGAMTLLLNPVVVFIVSVIGALLPTKLMVMLLALVLVGHMYAVSAEIAALLFVIILIMYLLFFRFTPKDSVILLLIPLLFFIKIPYVVPIVVGLVCTPVSIISVSFGVIIFYFLSYVGTNMDIISQAAVEDGIGQMTTVAKDVFTAKGLYLIIIAFALVTILVYFVKKIAVDYSWAIAVVTGGVVCIIIMLIGAIMFDMGNIVSVPEAVIGGIISIILALAVKFFVHSVDYSRTEYIQFEDDDYFYYVKAIPKIKVSNAEINVKRINARKVIK